METYYFTDALHEIDDDPLKFTPFVPLLHRYQIPYWILFTGTTLAITLGHVMFYLTVCVSRTRLIVSGTVVAPPNVCVCLLSPARGLMPPFTRCSAMERLSLYKSTRRNELYEVQAMLLC